MASRIQRELALLVTGKDVSATKTMRGVNKEISKLGKIGGKAGSNVARNIETSIAAGGALAIGAVGYSIQQAQGYESSSTSVRKTVNDNVDAILAANRKLATAKGFDVNALNEISATAGALDVQAKDIASFTETVALLGVTTDDVTTEMGAASFGHLKTTLKLAGDDFRELGDELIYLGNNGASTEGQILSMAENIAGAASTVGASKEQVLAWASAVASTGEEAEAGGSSIQRFWLESFKSVNKGGKELKLMAKISHQSAAQFKKDFGKDATGTLAKFLVSLSKLSKAEQVSALSNLGFTDIRITRALLKLIGNTDNLTGSLEDVQHAAGAMGAEAEKRFADSAQQGKIFEANLKDAAITIGTELLPAFNDLAGKGVDWLQNHQPEIKQFAEDLADGIEDAVVWAGKLDWDAIGNALEAGAGGAKMIIDAFLGAPPWLQQFLAVGFVANKFTGGAVMDVVGELGKGLIKGVLGMNAGVVNINAGVVNGGLGTGAAAAAGAASRGPLIGGLLTKLLGVGLVAGGAQGIGAGTSMGGPAGAAVGAAGGAAMIGGGALLLGPLGAIAGSVAAVGLTLKDIRDQSSSQATGVRTTADVWLQQSPSLSELQTGLAGVEQGIHDIESNPLNVLVAGDALDQLRATRTSLQQQIAKVGDNTVRTVAATERAEASMGAKELATAAATRDVRTGIEANRIAVQSGFSSAAAMEAATNRSIGAVHSATTAAGARAALAASTAGTVVAGAVARKDLSVTFSPTINTSVSVRETINTRTTYKQYFKTAR